MNMKKYIAKIFTVLAFILGPIGMALSQPNPPAPAPGSVPGGTPVLSCPVTDGYYILIALALAYGIYRIWQMKKVEEVA